MNKSEFLEQLRKKLSGLPQNDVEERLTFYSEMIDDRIEEGISEEQAVKEIGSINEIVAQILAEIPLTKIAMQRIKPKRRISVWEVVLIILGSPIWLSLGIAVIAVILSLYVSLWSVIICLWAVFGSLIGCSFGGVVSGIFLSFSSNVPSGIALIAMAIVCVGISILLFFGCKELTTDVLLLTKKFAIWTKSCFIKKEKA